jgi:uncharacterized protein (DUF2062 family)/2-polyprenyl-3-methyl-5-hydroxy-6-metoxy-1,4-benzoquinol methylase
MGTPVAAEVKKGIKNRIAGLQLRLKSFLRNLITEGLDPRHVFFAVFIGVYVGVVPIYGLQSLVSIGLATLFKLNKPLTFGATFINNPFLQPLLILSSVELGHCMLHGELLHLGLARIRNMDLEGRLLDWVAGSLVLGFILGVLAASLAALYVYFRATRSRNAKTDFRASARSVKAFFRFAPSSDRGFVRWKLRLDRIFELLWSESDCLIPSPISGPKSVVDLGCGYGIALAVIASRNPGIRLEGCDLDENRIRVGDQALKPLDARLIVEDMRKFELSNPDFILMIDVLQYLDPQEQRTLLKRCCAALRPQGKLIFRVPDRMGRVLSLPTKALDSVIFRFTCKVKKPVVLSLGEYEKALEDARMRVRKRRLKSRLPLAHIVFVAEHQREPEESLSFETLSS